jgi:hypothetical protein
MANIMALVAPTAHRMKTMTQTMTMAVVVGAMVNAVGRGPPISEEMKVYLLHHRDAGALKVDQPA